MRELGSNIRLFRRQRGLTQQELAEKADIGAASVARLESGLVADPRLSTLVKLSGALDTEVRELLPSEEDLRDGYRSGPA